MAFSYNQTRNGLHHFYCLFDDDSIRDETACEIQNWIVFTSNSTLCQVDLNTGGDLKSLSRHATKDGSINLYVGSDWIDVLIDPDYSDIAILFRLTF